MNSSVKSDETQSSSLTRYDDNKLFEKIVYFASGSIGEEVSSTIPNDIIISSIH